MPPALGLTCDVADGVGTILIDRPAKRNAMTAEMWEKLPVLLAGLAADPEVRVVVLTGVGDHFCAGADISELAVINRPRKGNLPIAAEEALVAFPKPTVAAIRGFCVGGGCQLAAACDLRFAADDARFGVPPAKLGLVYPVVPTTRLVRLIGPAAAKYLLFSGELITAEHALRVGLVDEVVEPGRLGARVAEFTALLAARSQLTQRAAKALVEAIAAGEPTDDLEREWLDRAAAGADAAEGVAAFQERRPAKFTWTGPGPGPG